MAQNKTAAREAAKREKEKSTVIYNKLADIAREAFALLTIEPGSYTAAKVAEAVAKYRAHWREHATAWHREDTADGIKAERLTAERWADTPARVEVDGFACQFPRAQVFDILHRFAVSAGIGSAARVTFTRTADEAQAIAEADERADERARALAAIDRRQREERRREEKREAERREAERRAARREEVKEKAREILATAAADLLAEYMTEDPALCLATACRDIDLSEAGEILAELTAAAPADSIEAETIETPAAPAADPTAAELADIAERMDTEARRSDAVRRIAARRRALLIRMTTGGRGKTAEAWKFARVTLSAYGEKVVTVWAVGMTETIYTRTYRVKADGSHYEVRHNYTTENTAAAANWLRSIHRAALLNGWGLTIETATAAEVKEADPAARLSSFIPGADRLADIFERLADRRAAERMTPAEVAAPAADLTAESEAEAIETPAAPAADSIEAPAAEVCPLTGETLTPGEQMTADEIRAAAAAERDRIEKEKAETIARADVETLAATWPGLTRAEILAELLTIDTDRAALLLAEVAAPDTLTDPAAWLAAPAADSIETPATADSIESEADPLPLLTIDTAAGVIVWGLADELPTADTITPADLLTIEAEHAESERERADRADVLTIATDDSQTAESDRAERRPLLQTIARHALRLAAAAALLLLLTIAPEHAADTLAAPADLTATPAPADLMTITPDTLTAAAPAADSIEAGTITAADLLTADSEAESRAELAAPADSPRPAAERRHAPANKRESHARALLLTVATADSIAAPLLLTADSIEADTLAAEVATLETLREITAPADTITTDDEPTADTDPATADSESDTDTQADTAASGHPHAHGSTPATMAAPCSTSAPLAPVAPILI
jgi:hypothetical protein